MKSDALRIDEAQFIASAANVEQLPPPTFPEIAFAGRSNVGKSSLINTLVDRRKLVRTSNTPGCTRALNLFRVTIGEANLDFVDLPGYGFAERSKSERRAWGTLIEGFLQRRLSLSGVIVIVDIRRGIEPDDEQLLDFLDHIQRPSIIVATKLDKLPLNKQKPALDTLKKKWQGAKIFGFSSETKKGREELWRQIFSVMGVPFPGAE